MEEHRWRKTRKRCTYSRQLECIACAEAIGLRAAAERTSVAYSTLAKWVNRKSAITAAAALPASMKSKRNIGKRKAEFPDLENELAAEVEERCKDGLRTWRGWLKLRFRKLMSIALGDVPLEDLPKPSQGWMTNFMRRFKLVYRAVTNRSPIPGPVRITTMLAEHTKLRAFLRASGPGRYGRFPPESRYNMDEVGLEIFPDHMSLRSIAKKGAQQVRVVIGGQSKLRRYATCTYMADFAR